MSKQLIIVRHGKAEIPEEGMSDFDRPLSKKGNRDTPEMAKRLTGHELIPELVVSSPAKRALTTAQHFSATWNMPLEKIRIEPSIYEANVMALLKVVNELENDYTRVALFGHNPGVTDFINFLSDGNVYEFPTAAVVAIDFPFDDWSLVSQHTGSLLFFDSPKRSDDD